MSLMIHMKSYYSTRLLNTNQITQPIEASSATRLNLRWSKCDECINRPRIEGTVIHSKAPTVEGKMEEEDRTGKKYI